MTPVRIHSKHREVLLGMTGRAEAARDRGIITESKVPEVLRKAVMADEPRRAERARDAIDDIARREIYGIVYMIQTMVGVCKDRDIREVEANVAAWGEARERANLGGEVRGETVNQKIMQIMGSFEGKKD